MLWRYWRRRALATEKALVEAKQEHMRDMTALVHAAGGVILVPADTAPNLDVMALTISPTRDGGTEYRRYFDWKRK